MEQSEACCTDEEEVVTPPKNLVQSPLDVRKYHMMKELPEKERAEQRLNLEEVPGLHSIEKVRRPKPSSTNTGVTQVWFNHSHKKRNSLAT